MVSPNPAPSSSLRGTLISPRCFFVRSFDSCLIDLVRARGIDLGAGGRSKKARRTAPRFDDVYLKLLVKTSSARIGLISTFLVSSVEDGSKFAASIRERLFTSKINQPSISLDGLISFTEVFASTLCIWVTPICLCWVGDDKITVIVGTVMDAKRHYEVLSLAVTAPRVMGTSEARILKVGSKCLTFNLYTACPMLLTSLILHCLLIFIKTFS
ncbi:hypothetical protein C4D60_Mb01t07510 [Musa balbisiana]|uniref:Large ribosomal subunit protein uL15/eL18 domain-containing protein n=1 Tax=Musa balbisiana TaxID=52838 RepID=A0A4S8JKK0_MUSBA|nr:hypothetical protein C4D60_Mb01t07510 [Musa balbisiana]